MAITDTNWKVVATADFNGDGKTDILWRNYATGDNVAWFMGGKDLDGTTIIGGLVLMAVTDTNWAIMGAGDFNGDGKTDIVWRNQVTGDNQVWYLKGDGIDGNPIGGDVILAVTDVNWTIGAVGDFNSDGKPDLFWRNQSTGDNQIWLMNGATLASGVVLSPVPPPWRVAAAGDVTSDGKTDVLWQDDTTGSLIVGQMDGTTVTCASYFSPPEASTIPTYWKMVGPR
jgi:hypothetical protein